MRVPPIIHGIRGNASLASGIASSLVLLGCGGGWPGPEMPAPLLPSSVTEVGRLVGETQVGMTSMMRFEWSYLEENATAEGRGSAIIVSPDSLRFDVRGPLGSGRSAAAVVGNAPLWVEPEDAVDKLVPNYPILWAMLGRARLSFNAERFEISDDGTTRAWRYVNGADTTEYILTAGDRPALSVDVRQSGERIGRVFTRLDGNGYPINSRLDVPSKPARLTLRFYRLDTEHVVDPTIWERPVDAQ